jgi:ABC-2 type transport system permease protein
MNSPIRNIFTIAKREFTSYFTSPVAYVFLVIFLLLAGFFTFMVGQDFFARNEASLGSFFLWHPWLYLFLVPAVAMRLWSEEKRTGTLELLLTLPITPTQAVIGKFLASWAFLILALVLTFPIWLTPIFLGKPDNGAILCAYIGSALMAGSYLAIGCMTSALTRNQVVSFILSVVICLFTILAGFPPVTDFIQSQFPGNDGIVTVVANLSVMTHFEALQRGVLHLRDLVFFLSVIVLALFATAAIIRSDQETKKAEGFALSTVQVVVLAGILLLLNAIIYPVRAKADLTENNIHTLTDGTKNILKRLNEERGDDGDSFKVEARLYFTRGEDRVQVAVRQYAARVDELLKEYRDTAKGDIIYNRIDPQPDTNEQELADHDSIAKMQVGLEEFAYLGLTLSYADRTEKVNLLEQGAGGRIRGLRPEGMLEYDISAAITRLLPEEEEKPVIGIMSPLQIMGGFPPGMPPQMMRNQRPAQPWIIAQALMAAHGRSNIKQMEMSADKINYIDERGVEKVPDLLLVIHPKDISERTEFALDQYVLGGGKLAVFLDPHHAMDQGPMGGFGGGESRSTLNKLLPAWGLSFSDRMILSDKTYGLRPPRSGIQFPTAVDIQREDHSEIDPIVRNLGPLSGIHFGAFTGNAKDKGLSQTMLFQSSTNSMMILGSQAKALFPFPSFQKSQAQIAKDFTGTSQTNILALKLTGPFKTAFNDGDPEAIAPDANSTTPKPADTALKVAVKSKTPAVVLVGDVDFLHDAIHQLDQLRGFRNSNVDFLLNLVDHLTGDEDLIRIRGLANRSRPLKKLNEMEEKATADIQEELDKHEKDLEEADEKASEVAKKIQDQLQQALQTGKTGVIRLQVTEEDRKKLEDSQAQAEVARDTARKSIRRIKKKRTAAVTSLRNRIKWYSIAGMPFLITLFGIGLAIQTRKQTQA